VEVKVGSSPYRVRVGTRGSKLALVQTELVVAGLRARFPDVEFTTRVIRTEGDRRTRLPVSEIGDKGIFVRVIEQALLDGGIDLAVHSLKDVPSDGETPGLELAGFPPREDPRDVVVAAGDAALDTLPPGSRVGTGSLRRLVQLRERRPDLEVVGIRGNVDTRLRKLDDGEYDAIVLAAAGLRRLGMANRISEYLPPERFLPDAGQGILALQIRMGDGRMLEMVRTLDDRVTRLAAVAERAALRALGADCRSPVGVLARLQDDVIQISGMAGTSAAGPVRRASHRGPAHEGERVGRELGERLIRALSGEP
jgi:hydroxymethylbilane synthase